MDSDEGKVQLIQINSKLVISTRRIYSKSTYICVIQTDIIIHLGHGAWRSTQGSNPGRPRNLV